jgi:hypothetical protein
LGNGNFNLFFSAEVPVSDIVLTPEQETEARRLADLVGKKVQEETLQMFRLKSRKIWDRDPC